MTETTEQQIQPNQENQQQEEQNQNQNENNNNKIIEKKKEVDYVSII